MHRTGFPPFLLILPPAVVDQSAPRGKAELVRASVALSALSDLVNSGSVVLAITRDIEEMATDYDPRGWSLMPPTQRDVKSLLAKLLLRGVGILRITSRCGGEGVPHPLPIGVSLEQRHLGDFWATDIGRLLELHRNCKSEGRFNRCIGIACDYAFSGLPINSYQEPFEAAFLLVGPSDLHRLESLRDYEVPAHSHNFPVTVNDVENNYPCIGASGRGFGGDHPEIHFPNGSKWSYSRNWKPAIKDEKLKQLTHFTGMSLPAVRYALSQGRRPPLRIRPCYAPGNDSL